MSKLDRKLNITATIDAANGPFHIHSMPVNRRVFEDNFELLAAVHARLNQPGMTARTSPAVARMALLKAAKEMDLQAEAQIVIAEIRRLTHVCYSSATGIYQFMPVASAIADKIIDEDDLADIDSYLIFFTLVSWIEPKMKQKMYMEILCHYFELATTQLSISDFASSLQMLTPDGNTGETVTA